MTLESKWYTTAVRVLLRDAARTAAAGGGAVRGVRRRLHETERLVVLKNAVSFLEPFKLGTLGACAVGRTERGKQELSQCREDEACYA